MTRHDDLARLRHMLEHAREAVSMVAGKEGEDLRTERMLELALVRLIEIIGKAAARVSPEGQLETPPYLGARWSGCVTVLCTVTTR